jgi:hypothetical protein
MKAAPIAIKALEPSEKLQHTRRSHEQGNYGISHTPQIRSRELATMRVARKADALPAQHVLAERYRSPESPPRRPVSACTGRFGELYELASAFGRAPEGNGLRVTLEGRASSGRSFPGT